MTKDELNLTLEALEKYANAFGASDLSLKAMSIVRDSLAQPEQKPVALETVYETIIQWDEGGGKRSRRELARRIVSLYTTPPQSKPLTDEEIILIVAECAASHQHTDIHFARAIERAHGIKELV